MIKTILKIVALTIFISCNDVDEPKEVNYIGFIEKDIVLSGYDENFDLTDSLCLVSLKIPARLDTFYRWRHSSCNSSSSWMKYRFADKTYPQFEENGWFWTVVPDSVYQLNIWHRPIKETPDSITLKPLSKKDTVYCYYHPHLVGNSKSPDLLLKEFKLINERPFVISAFVNPYGYLSDSRTLFVIAETTLKRRELYFIGECAAKDTIGFIDNMYKSFLSIRIKENP